MTEALTKAMARIREQTPKLNQATDEANSVVKGIETFLNDECSVGIPVKVEISTSEPIPCHPPGQIQDDDGYHTCEICWLSYERVGNKFRVAIVVEKVLGRVGEHGFEHESTLEREVTPWLDSSRDLKLETFPELRFLIEELAGAVEIMTEQTSIVASDTQTMLEALQYQA